MVKGLPSYRRGLKIAWMALKRGAMELRLQSGLHHDPHRSTHRTSL